MNSFYKWFAQSPLASFLRVFVAILLASAVPEFVALGSFDFSKWQSWVIAALASATPLLLRWLNPADPMGS